ncbi:hypothetical protein DRO26_03290 [Candidatus Bathyarchaeota archaeon]|nr:MAG: hypothetical protein DRO26_03290 [Candidatus Bathyarchaeota archaeon]
MRLFKKENETVHVLCFPDEEVEKGDYLVIEDFKSKKSLLVQVVDIQFVNFPGLMEDLLRDNLTETSVFGDDFDPLNLESQIILLRDARILVGKIRCSIEGKKINMNVSWLPSRTSSRIYKIEVEKLFELLNLGRKRPIKVGETKRGSELLIDAEDLDGGLSIITGRKGTGKSHLAKLLMLGLVDHGAPCVVFDVNGEYVNLGFHKNGEKNQYYDKIVVLEPGRNFKVNLMYVGKNVLTNILAYVLGLPETSLREFFRVWNETQKTGFVTLKKIKEFIRISDLNEHVKEAILSRLYILESFSFFTEEDQILKVEDVLVKISNGGIIVLNLSRVSSLERKIVVEFMLGKLVEMLRKWIVKAIFLFAEEAHLYLRETYWEDIVTRMRHLGLFTVFITNQPDSIQEDIYRQADSIFLFNFKNENDLNVISKVAKVDGETMKSIANSLEPHHCLTIGQITREVPVVIKIKELDIKTMGETRKFFN